MQRHPSMNYLAAQPHKMARGLKIGIYVIEVLYYPYNENNGADQLRGTRS